MVLPQFFLDNTRDHARDIIAASGVNMLAAYRLPDNLFENAKVAVDIVFLKKTDSNNRPWQKTKPIRIGNHTKPINEYFLLNPSHILGELEVIPMYERTGITCRPSGILREKLKEVFLKTPKL